MLLKIVIERPVDPFQFFIDQLQKPLPTSILVIGPPSSGQAAIIKSLVRTLDAVHVHSGSLIRNAIKRETTLGIQAKAFLDRGHPVPDALASSLVLAHLCEETDIAERGFILEGFPRTREQAAAMIRIGIIPNHTIVFDIPDDRVISHAFIEERLTKPALETATRERLKIYRQNIPGVLQCLRSNIRMFRYPKGIASFENAVLGEVYGFLKAQPISNAPACYKILISGLAGSGKSRVAEAIERKYGHVHVSPRKVILEEVAAGSHWGKTLGQFANNPEQAPQGYLVELIAARLKRRDCLDKGWVLDGFPLSKTDAEDLRSKGVAPNRLVWLETDTETCFKRLVHRRYDPAIGRVANLLALPEDLHHTDLSSWVSRAEDSEEWVTARLARQANLRDELKKMYGYRNEASPLGIMYAIDAGGLGEGDSKNGSIPFDRVLELVESSLLRPIAIDQRIEY
ncbi:hypothetical protein BASA83_009379 [Batrachochytrium salamandrivorans]|nr:hypothetical protein BASA81_010181 [Batrachochytrium salamandrivorans]KAH9268380.1 hypothetical protein BASA83_009379 [Batrachochytrium salamandrivorans]